MLVNWFLLPAHHFGVNFYLIQRLVGGLQVWFENDILYDGSETARARFVLVGLLSDFLFRAACEVKFTSVLLEVPLVLRDKCFFSARSECEQDLQLRADVVRRCTRYGR